VSNGKALDALFKSIYGQSREERKPHMMRTVHEAYAMRDRGPWVPCDCEPEDLDECECCPEDEWLRYEVTNAQREDAFCARFSSEEDARHFVTFMSKGQEPRFVELDTLNKAVPWHGDLVPDLGDVMRRGEERRKWVSQSRKSKKR
jgi:hypothetical protein